MTDQDTLAKAPWFFRPTQHRAIARALPSGVVWSYAAGLAQVVIILVLGIVTALVSSVMYLLNNDVSVLDNIRTVVGGAVWVLTPVVLVVAIGAVVYAATTRKSLVRSAVGVAAAAVAGSGLFLVFGASTWVAATLAVGWGAGLPAERPGRVALRIIPPLALSAVPAVYQRLGRIDGLAAWELLLIVLLSPLLAALWVWLSDLLWVAGTARSKTPTEVEA